MAMFYSVGRYSIPIELTYLILYAGICHPLTLKGNCMKLLVKPYLSQVLLVVTSIFLSSSISAGSFKGDWTANFYLQYGHYVIHTPKYVNLDDMFIVGNGLHLENLVINGTKFSNVHLLTDSTREEFAEAIRRIKITKT